VILDVEVETGGLLGKPAGASEDAGIGNMRSLASRYRDLRNQLKMLRSAEFRAALRGVSLPFDRPALEIETAASPEQSSQMFARIRDAWSELGVRRPHHSVLTTDQFRPGNFAANGERFWASGELEVQFIVAALARHGFGEPDGMTCVEYGSGVGRVTLPLAARFAVVHAYEMSPTHLRLAQQRAAALATGNIDFHACADGLPVRLAPCDLFYSRLVLQHNPPPLIRALIALALAALNPGGFAIFGVPTYLEHYRFRTGEYLLRPRAVAAEMHCIPQEEVFALIAEAGCATVEVREERELARSGERLSNIFVVKRPPGG